MALNEENPKFIYNSVIVVVIQCKQKSLFDSSAASLITTKFCYYIYNNID